MARTTITLEPKALENLSCLQSILEERWGAKVTQGFAIAYAVKETIEREKLSLDVNDANK